MLAWETGVRADELIARSKRVPLLAMAFNPGDRDPTPSVRFGTELEYAPMKSARVVSSVIRMRLLRAPDESAQAD
jgi:hypothetical protein